MTLTLSQAFQLAAQRQAAGQLAEAERLCSLILQQDPRHAYALQLLGVIAGQSGRVDLAIDLIQKAIAIHSGDFGFHSNLAKFLIDAGHFAEARAAAGRAIELEPHIAEPYYNQGIALQGLSLPEDAIIAYRRAIELQPNHAQAHANLSNIYKDAGEISQAIDCLRQAVQHAPTLAAARSNLLYCLHFSPEYSSEELLAEHRHWNQAHGIPLQLIPPYLNSREADRPLRVGLVSPDFNEHPVSRFLLAFLKCYDRQNFHITCYSNNPGVPDDTGTHIMSLADHWEPISHLSDDVAEVLIRSQQIDILVDLSMHMFRNRLPLFARKPAPAQATYLAYCSTTGLAAIDYRISDPFLDPLPSGISHLEPYSEKTIRLAQTYWCYTFPPDIPAVNPLPALAAGHITFACLSNFCKVSDDALRTWAGILNALPSARLYLHVLAGLEERVKRRLVKCGIDPSRCLFSPFLPFRDYLILHEHIDIALDPFPCNGGTTSCDALSMGVPVITLGGKTAVGRGGVSVLSNLGLPELIAQTPEDYIRIAVALAQNLPRLQELRATLRTRMQNSPLMNAVEFSQNLQSAFRSMWREWCAEGEQGGLAPPQP
ncbi:MAG TPA: tetratricopeptide repeat protein [Phycisphaerae bacterium]|jgi:predicted O-linked N-acetylglucosamine transferase (SPINDLY family)